MTREEAIKCLKELPFLSLKSNSDWAVEKDINNQVAVRMAILALEQEPCEDCISRADVEQTVEDNILCYTHSDRPIDQDPDTDCHKAIRIALKMLRKDLRKLPPVTPQPKAGHWIPCSERLPERYKAVIVTDIETSDTYQSEYVGNGYWECDNGTLKNRIIAWMPLPEPFRTESEETDADREESKAYCAECDHIEMCSWYPHDGCEWLKTDRYNAGYNAAKREIALSREYERAYERGKADAQPKIGRWIAYEVRLPDRTILNYRCSVCGRKLIGYNTETLSEAPFCHCGAKMIDPQESEDKE